MVVWFRARYLILVASIYLYNEHRGYTALDRLLEGVRARSPIDQGFVDAVRKHRSDERKHYLMFRRWFERRGEMPLMVDRTCGHIDRFVEIMFRSRIDGLDTTGVAGNDRKFEKLCRIISLTERRGYRQVEILLRHPIVRRDRSLLKIFRIIKQDEPSHWQPYDEWLCLNGKREPRWWERLIDAVIHSELLFLKLPVLFLNPFLQRRVDWPDAHELRGRVPRAAW